MPERQQKEVQLPSAVSPQPAAGRPPQAIAVDGKPISTCRTSDALRFGFESPTARDPQSPDAKTNVGDMLKLDVGDACCIQPRCVHVAAGGGRRPHRDGREGGLQLTSSDEFGAVGEPSTARAAGHLPGYDFFVCGAEGARRLGPRTRRGLKYGYRFGRRRSPMSVGNSSATVGWIGVVRRIVSAVTPPCIA
jgi:hypothetical protein